jgi:hypothetical protein
MEEVNIKATWEGVVYEYIRILFNPDTELTRKGEQDIRHQLLHVARMADKWAEHVEGGAE